MSTTETQDFEITWRVRGQRKIRKTQCVRPVGQQPTEEEAVARCAEAWGIDPATIIILSGTAAKTNLRTFRVVVADDNGTAVFSEEITVPWTEGEHASRPARRALAEAAESVRLGLI